MEFFILSRCQELLPWCCSIPHHWEVGEAFDSTSHFWRFRGKRLCVSYCCRYRKKRFLQCKGANSISQRCSTGALSLISGLGFPSQRVILVWLGSAPFWGLKSLFYRSKLWFLSQSCFMKNKCCEVSAPQNFLNSHTGTTTSTSMKCVSQTLCSALVWSVFIHIAWIKCLPAAKSSGWSSSEQVTGTDSLSWCPCQCL